VPWGITLAPAGFGTFGGDLLVGNFSFVDSEIKAFDPTIGAFLGTIPVDPAAAIHLWALRFGDGDPNTLYFNDGIISTMASTARRTGCSRPSR
jgi:hypothetical protein